jgi:hypothetical protein
MKFIDNWFYKRWIKARRTWEEAPVEVSNTKTSSNIVGGVERLRTKGMNFTIYPANGGHVLEYISYDERTDKNNCSLHLIGAEQNLGDTIAHAITLEMLKR